jgi:transcriptional regulator with XRE-family HTH domain
VGTSIHSENYRMLLVMIRDLRTDAGLSQTEVATRLGRPQSWVSKVEVGERRIDVEELSQLCEAIGADPTAVLTHWLMSTARSQRSH